MMASLPFSCASHPLSKSYTVRYARYAWSVLVLHLAVIAWGAFVRATGSGAGCGRHWPRCLGEIIPRAPSLATQIEFTHRLTSALALLSVVGLVVGARRYPPGHLVRRGAYCAAGFEMGEALLGAGLVLFSLVARNTSLQRGVSISLHLVNTFFLLGALACTAVWASGGHGIRLRKQGAVLWLVGGALFSTLAVGAAGAVAALGDTLFPSPSLAEGLAQDLSSTAPLFVRLRLVHPFGAILLSVALVALVRVVGTYKTYPSVHRVGKQLQLLLGVQLVAGVVNVGLLAPVWMQLVHLVLADMLWITLVLFSLASLADRVETQSNPSVCREGLDPLDS